MLREERSGHISDLASVGVSRPSAFHPPRRHRLHKSQRAGNLSSRELPGGARELGLQCRDGHGRHAAIRDRSTVRTSPSRPGNRPGRAGTDASPVLHQQGPSRAP